jgi:hypothetical protein
MRVILNRAMYVAKYAGYKSPTSTPEQMVSEWNKQDGECAACGGLFINDSRKISYDHNHETGEPRGFVHGYCNTLEGLFTKMTQEELLTFIEWIKKIHNRNS